MVEKYYIVLEAIFLILKIIGLCGFRTLTI